MSGPRPIEGIARRSLPVRLNVRSNRPQTALRERLPLSTRVRISRTEGTEDAKKAEEAEAARLNAKMDSLMEELPAAIKTFRERVPQAFAPLFAKKLLDLPTWDSIVGHPDFPGFVRQNVLPGVLEAIIKGLKQNLDMLEAKGFDLSKSAKQMGADSPTEGKLGMAYGKRFATKGLDKKAFRAAGKKKLLKNTGDALLYIATCYWIKTGGKP